MLNNPLILVDPDGKQVKFGQAPAGTLFWMGIASGHIKETLKYAGATLLAGAAILGGAEALPYVTAAALSNPVTTNEIGIAITEALAPGAENLGIGKAIEAFKSFDKAGKFGELANKIGIEGLSGNDLKRAFGGILAKASGSEYRQVIDELQPLIGVSGAKSTMLGSKLIEFIPDASGKVTVKVSVLGEKGWTVIGTSTTTVDKLPFKELGVDISDPLLNKHQIGKAEQ